MKLNIAPISSDRFSFDAKTRLFTAEASDLQNQHLNPLYDDAADVGLVMVSSKTGKTVRYYMIHETRGAENEIESWDYYPTTESIREVPECQGTSVTVFND